MKTFGIKNSFIFTLAALSLGYVFSSLIVDLDFWFENFVFGLRNTFWTGVIEKIAVLGQWQVVVFLGAIFSYYLWKKAGGGNNIQRLQIFWTMIVGSLATVFFLKNIFFRERPFGAEFYEGFTSSFPSNHTIITFVFFGYLANYIYYKTDWRPAVKYTLVGLLLSLIAIMGFGRIYLGVHYFSDIVAAFLIAWFILNAAIRKSD